MSRKGIVYLLQCKVNSKCYVGQTISTLSHRWAQHKHAAARGETDMILSSAIRKHSPDNFILSVLGIAEAGEELDSLEENFIKTYNSRTPNGYNVLPGGRTNRRDMPMPRCRPEDKGLPMYVSYFFDSKALSEGYLVRHTPSGQTYKSSSKHMTLEQRLSAALHFLEEAQKGVATKPELKTMSRGNKIKELPKGICKFSRTGRRDMYKVQMPGYRQRSFSKLEDAMKLLESQKKDKLEQSLVHQP